MYRSHYYPRYNPRCTYPAFFRPYTQSSPEFGPEDEDLIDIPAQKFVRVDVSNDEAEEKLIYFFIKMDHTQETIQYGDPVQLQPGASAERFLPEGVQIDTRIQIYSSVGTYLYWCRKIWGKQDIQNAIAVSQPLQATTSEISTSNCSSYTYPTWITRGSILVPTKYLVLGVLTNNPTPYQILGLPPQNVRCSDVRKAYRRLALKWHPDKYGGNKDFARTVFITIKDAYDSALTTCQR